MRLLVRRFPLGLYIIYDKIFMAEKFLTVCLPPVLHKLSAMDTVYLDETVLE